MGQITAARDLRGLFREFYPRLFRFIFVRTDVPSGDVEDIAQETLLHAWQQRDRFVGHASPESWVFSIARHKIADFWRDRGRAPLQLQDAVHEALLRMDETPIPEKLLGCAEMRQRVGEALDRLDEDYAAMLRWRYLEGLPVRRIAEARGESE